MDEKKINKLMKMLKDSDLSELTVEEDGVKITVRKGPLTIIERKGDLKQVHTEEISSDRHTASDETSSEVPYKEIVSPMVGTLYLSSAPDADQFVHEGDEVERGQTVCIIEAMKLMNEISIEEKGKIVKILVENAKPVQYGQALFLYEPVV